MKNVAKDIRERTFKPVYLLCGDENYLKTNCKKQLKQAIIGEDSMNFHYYEGKGISVEQVIDVAETMPFFADYRLILMENTGFFKSAGGTLPEYLKEKPESTIFVFVESEVDKRNKLYKTVKEIGYVCEMNVPSRNELQRWLLGGIKKAGKQIDRETLELFFNLVGDEDMHTLSNELEKVISYDLDNPVITKESIYAICSRRIEVRIFDLFSAMAEGNVRRTMECYYELVENKEPYMRILFMLGRQFSQMLSVKSMSSQGRSPQEIAGRLGMRNDWAVRQLQRQGSRYSEARLKQAVADCVANEEAVKTGNLPEQEAVEMILVKYGKLRKRQETAR